MDSANSLLPAAGFSLALFADVAHDLQHLLSSVAVFTWDVHLHMQVSARRCSRMWHRITRCRTARAPSTRALPSTSHVRAAPFPEILQCADSSMSCTSCLGAIDTSTATHLACECFFAAQAASIRLSLLCVFGRALSSFVAWALSEPAMSPASCGGRPAQRIAVHHGDC